ncbi:hypothetical protein C0991_011107 [Blastosporella zonata]|nr:hypothetical protein C0991_011107 [Blastosporella zonata]
MSTLQKDEDGFYAPVADQVKEESDDQNPRKNSSRLLIEELHRLTDYPELSEWLNSAFEVTVTLADQQGDSKSPLHSVKTFEELGLHKDLLTGIYDMGFSKPSNIQETALPLLLANPPTNMIGQSQSGTGKTAAFVLTMLSRIDYTINKPQALCLAPSRELARQIMLVVRAMGKYTPVQTEFAIKDTPLTNPTAHIVVGTPGTVHNLMRQKAPDRQVIDLSAIKVFVLDEADIMLGQEGLGDQILRIKKCVVNSLNFTPTTESQCNSSMLPRSQPVQIILFSATFPDYVRSYSSKFAPNANKIELQKEELSVDNIRQFYMDCKSESDKYRVLESLYQLLTISQSIIFCRHKRTVNEIAGELAKKYHKVASLHGNMEASERDAIINRFQKGDVKVLITTNVMARGIDIAQVNMVVNYDMPVMHERGKTADERPDIETYIHRIGRTGRFGRKGISINFVHDEKTWNQMNQIEKALSKSIVRIETHDIDEMEKTMNKALK